MRTRKGTHKFAGNIREAKPPPDNRVRELNGPPVRVWTREQERAWLEGHGPPPFD